MKFFAYGVAVLAAIGIMIFVATSSDQASTESATADAVQTVDALTGVELASTKLNVPYMHCPHACYPRVKENLENEASILSVELVPQDDADVIDTPHVIVKHKEGFDIKDALAKLESVGFGDSSVVE